MLIFAGVCLIHLHFRLTDSKTNLVGHSRYHSDKILNSISHLIRHKYAPMSQWIRQVHLFVSECHLPIRKLSTLLPES